MRREVLALLLGLLAGGRCLSPPRLHGSRALSSHPQGPERLILRTRGGLSAAQTALALRERALSSPSSLFNALFLALAAGIAVIRALPSGERSSGRQEEKPREVVDLQLRFLPVFWLMRMSDWMQGPYFYEVYASKVLAGRPVALETVSRLFLVGFASTGLFGPWVGRQVDSRGRRLGTLVFALLYSLGALSTRSSVLSVLLLGRLAGGIGTSLLFSAPESWLVGEHIRSGADGRWLGQTFGWAYAGDSVVAILAGQLASLAAQRSGPSGPFTASLLSLALGSLLCGLTWRENVAASEDKAEEKSSSIGEAAALLLRDKRILLVGLVQALFEGAMYIFVLQWPPAIKAAISSSGLWTAAEVPYGKIFSCFMASCLFGSSVFGKLQAMGVGVETSTPLMLTAATASVAYAAFSNSPALLPLVAAFFIFEMCVGMYFPSIGTLRSKYLPDANRSVLMNLFGIPLNLIVVSVFLSIKTLGVQGALSFASLALGIASASMMILTGLSRRKISK